MSRITRRTHAPSRRTMLDTVPLNIRSLNGGPVLVRVRSDGTLAALIESPAMTGTGFRANGKPGPVSYTIGAGRLAPRGVYELPFTVDLGNGKRGPVFVAVDRTGSMVAYEVAEPGKRGFGPKDTRAFVAWRLDHADPPAKTRKVRHA